MDWLIDQFAFTRLIPEPGLVENYRELYHYTTYTGLKGIVESNTLWAFHYSGMNDKGTRPVTAAFL